VRGHTGSRVAAPFLGYIVIVLNLINMKICVGKPHEFHRFEGLIKSCKLDG
jgi:hypothetical protein